MKTEEEIRKKIKEYQHKIIENKISLGMTSSEYKLAILVLNWVLESEEE